MAVAMGLVTFSKAIDVLDVRFTLPDSIVSAANLSESKCCFFHSLLSLMVVLLPAAGLRAGYANGSPVFRSALRPPNALHLRGCPKKWSPEGVNYKFSWLLSLEKYHALDSAAER
uniref:Uncharacterized protein n=1 Tax=Schistocephalus solidus TaxID=70667 RepID=A0A0V0J1G9_SCHSO